MGEAFVMALAARRTVPEGLDEALRVEGASAWFATSRPTLPLMAPLWLAGRLALRQRS